MTQLALLAEATSKTTANKPAKTFDENINRFVRNLEELEPGERARLKRSAGKSLAEATSAIGLFYRVLPYSVPRYQDEMYFLVATLYAIRYREQEIMKSTNNFGASLRLARDNDPDKNKGLDRRVEILLDSEQPEQLAYRLRQAVRLLKARDVPINWHQLLQDLLRWERYGHYVQQNWSRSYFVGTVTDDEEE